MDEQLQAVIDLWAASVDRVHAAEVRAALFESDLRHVMSCPGVMTGCAWCLGVARRYLPDIRGLDADQG